ncbi:hypothetical protein GCM10010339_92120 [Streptomyces alanosinicus]|uniref:Uncharacterized protein n=1 Tax=Streptomyces alanosinicus TaxID=68171 RepID=A0A918YTN0_9ACTN|nr:hypothetical protein GCM10010339_92120 [Streptomyces alanosinicus]
MTATMLVTAIAATPGAAASRWSDEPARYPRTGLRAGPRQTRDQAVRGEMAVAEPGGAGDVRGEGPQEGHEAAHQQRRPAPPLYHLPCPVPGRCRYPSAQAALPYLVAQTASGALGEQITGDDADGGAADDERKVEHFGMGEEAHAQHQAQGGHKSAHHEHGFQHHQAQQCAVRRERPQDHE